jgi:hypothetical protein
VSFGSSGIEDPIPQIPSEGKFVMRAHWTTPHHQAQLPKHHLQAVITTRRYLSGSPSFRIIILGVYSCLSCINL